MVAANSPVLASSGMSGRVSREFWRGREPAGEGGRSVFSDRGGGVGPCGSGATPRERQDRSAPQSLLRMAPPRTVETRNGSHLISATPGGTLSCESLHHPRQKMIQ